MGAIDARHKLGGVAKNHNLSHLKVSRAGAVDAGTGARDCHRERGQVAAGAGRAQQPTLWAATCRTTNDMNSQMSARRPPDHWPKVGLQCGPTGIVGQDPADGAKPPWNCMRKIHKQALVSKLGAGS